MSGAAVALAVVVGLVAGWAAGSAADRIAGPRYGPGTAGDDPDDRALAPLAAPTTARVRTAVGLATGLAGGAVAAAFERWEVALPLWALAWVLVVATVVDLQYLRLPNVLTLGGAAVTLGLVTVMSIRLDVVDAVQGAVVGAITYATFLLVVAEGFRALAGRSGLGLGDVKLALSLGLTAGWVGWRSDLAMLGPLRLVILAALLGNLLGAVGGLVLTKLQPKRSFPFGPFLAAGWLLAVLLD
ncbi:MAG: prepilin peptidase [Acidimicrobiales bacterium]